MPRILRYSVHEFPRIHLECRGFYVTPSTNSPPRMPRILRYSVHEFLVRIPTLLRPRIHTIEAYEKLLPYNIASHFEIKTYAVAK